MSNEKSNWEILNNAIQSRLNDDQWDNLIVQRIAFARRENNRKWIQFALLPGILLTATSIFYLTGGHGNKAAHLAKAVHSHSNSPANSTKRATDNDRNNNFKLHIIDVVFSKLE